MPVATPAELASYLHSDVDTSSATTAIRVSTGWLLGATRLSALPEPVTEALWAVQLELAAIAYVNPRGLTRERLADSEVDYSAERRDELLAQAARVYAGVGVPLWSFPYPATWPDPHGTALL